VSTLQFISALLGQKRGCDPPPYGRSRSLGLDRKVAPTHTLSHTYNFALRILSLIRLEITAVLLALFFSLSCRGELSLSLACVFLNGGWRDCVYGLSCLPHCACVALRARSILYMYYDKKQAERDEAAARGAPLKA
jgi:hypothetical protein